MNEGWMMMKKNECGDESRKVIFGVRRFSLCVFPFSIWTNFIDEKWENETVKRRNKGRKEKRNGDGWLRCKGLNVNWEKININNFWTEDYFVIIYIIRNFIFSDQ